MQVNQSRETLVRRASRTASYTHHAPNKRRLICTVKNGLGSKSIMSLPLWVEKLKQEVEWQ